mmetsp:Transcript_105101/g.267003  ORF Transcript_105101/g.267003 Transcript_105101/m.267003 type:complete len:206 (+) Transcript_105101:151-768(+)
MLSISPDALPESSAMQKRRSSAPAGRNERPTNTRRVSRERRAIAGSGKASASAALPEVRCHLAQATREPVWFTTAATTPMAAPSADADATAKPAIATPKTAPAVLLRPPLRTSSSSTSCEALPGKAAKDAWERTGPVLELRTNRASTSAPALCTTYSIRTKFRRLMPMISSRGGQKPPLSGPTSGDIEIIPLAPYIQSSISPEVV